MFLVLYIHFTRQDQVAIPTDVWMIPLGYVTTHFRQTLLHSAEYKDKFVSGPDSALRRVAEGVTDENERSALSCSSFTSWEIRRYSLNTRPISSQCLLDSLEKGKITCCCYESRRCSTAIHSVAHSLYSLSYVSSIATKRISSFSKVKKSCRCGDSFCSLCRNATTKKISSF